MRYFVAEDEFYYSSEGSDHIISQFDDIEEVIMFPDETILSELIKGKRKLSKVAFLAPWLPGRISKAYDRNHFFDITYLENRYGFLTFGQKRSGIDPEQVLESKLGVRIEKRHEKMSDYGGADVLHEIVFLIKEKTKYGITTNGFFLAGMPGTGKSFFAKCVAGELGYMLVSLNLSAFMEKDDPIYEVQSFFRFFEENPGDYVLWMDELEKMFDGENTQSMMGQLLTSISDAAKVSKANFFIIATANKLNKLTKQNAELFRMGRFDQVIFLVNPTPENARKIFELYIKKRQEDFKNMMIPAAIKNYSDASPKNTIANQIGIFFHDQYRGDALLIQKIKDLTIPQVAAIINKDEAAARIIQEIQSRYNFIFNIHEFMRISTGAYREEGNNMIDRYIYTPAEIEVIIQRAYSEYYLLPQKDINYLALTKTSKPLQATMKDSIQEILAKSTNFLKV